MFLNGFFSAFFLTRQQQQTQPKKERRLTGLKKCNDAKVLNKDTAFDKANPDFSDRESFLCIDERARFPLSLSQPLLHTMQHTHL